MVENTHSHKTSFWEHTGMLTFYREYYRGYTVASVFCAFIFGLIALGVMVVREVLSLQHIFPAAVIFILPIVVAAGLIHFFQPRRHRIIFGAIIIGGITYAIWLLSPQTW